MSRFYNVDSGRILIDGVDIAGVTIRSLRKQMGVMMQDSFIFSGTIMDNIRYGNFSATDEEVIRLQKRFAPMTSSWKWKTVIRHR